jgi:hypothetical protein
MKIRALFSAVALLLAMAFSSQSTYAGALVGEVGYWGPYPYYFGDYPVYDGDYPPNPLYAPYGYYGCRGGCCRRAVWSGRHWHNVTTCHQAMPAARISPGVIF